MKGNVKMKIIVASERETVHERTKRIFDSYEAVECDNFLDAISAVSQNQNECKIAISDYELTPYNGIVLLESIKRIKNNIRTILLIDRGNEAIELEGLLKPEIDSIIELEKSDAVIQAYTKRLLGENKLMENSYINKGRQLIVNGQIIPLTRTELKIAKVLLDNEGDIVTREEISRIVWGGVEILNVRRVDIHIKSIRGKLAAKDCFNYINTVSGAGYRWGLEF